jgi:hypothetical protein
VHDHAVLTHDDARRVAPVELVDLAAVDDQRTVALDDAALDAAVAAGDRDRGAEQRRLSGTGGERVTDPVDLELLEVELPAGMRSSGNQRPGAYIQ